MSTDVELPGAAQAVQYLEFVQDWLSGVTKDAMVRLGLLTGEAPLADLLLSVSVEELRSVIAALGELMAMPVEPAAACHARKGA